VAEHVQFLNLVVQLSRKPVALERILQADSDILILAGITEKDVEGGDIGAARVFFQAGCCFHQSRSLTDSGRSGKQEQRGIYILYLPRSSSFRFSSQRLTSSLLIRS